MGEYSSIVHNYAVDKTIDAMPQGAKNKDDKAYKSNSR